MILLKDNTTTIQQNNTQYPINRSFQYPRIHTNDPVIDDLFVSTIVVAAAHCITNQSIVITSPVPPLPPYTSILLFVFHSNNPDHMI